MSQTIPPTDLTQRPPRSARAQLGGYVLLPRMLDKCRAELAGKNGEYHYNCPLDQRLLEFLGLDAEAIKKEVAKGKGDGEILEWINEKIAVKHTAWEIESWSRYQSTRVASGFESREFFNKLLGSLTKTREDIVTWADLLDLDDYVSFGGKA
ncbi:MAG: DUF5069 domain-containing protein [Verrucomicrobiota bacterium]